MAFSKAPLNQQISKRAFSLFSSSASPTVSKGNMLDLDNSIKHCTETVQKFDYYTWRVG